ncbi:MAG: ATP-binding protein [Burkholderiaceae bacterium]
MVSAATLRTGDNDRDQLLARIESLESSLAEAQATLNAIGSGEVDALIVGDKLFVLEGVEAATNRFRGEVMAQLDDAIIAADNELRVTYFNAAAERQYGVKASEALGRPLRAIYTYRWLNPDDRNRCRDALDSGGTWRGSNTHVKRSGEEIHVESSVKVMRDASGSKSGVLAVIRDVSARVDAEREYSAQRTASELALREADRHKDEFLATLAHELRNPMAPIANALQIMQLTRDAAAVENARGIIGRQLQQMVHLVDDLMDVSRIRQGKFELRREHVDVVRAIEAAVETSRPLIVAGRHALSVHLPPPSELVVNADLTRLCQIVGNLLNNAAKFTPEGGQIELHAERDGSDAKIRVRDSGIGIAASKMPRIFDMFSQIERPLERTYGGLGIGLSLVKRLVEMHGGTVTAHSEGGDRGCEFVVRLPLAVNGPEHVQPKSELPAHAQQSTALQVLVADDNVDNAQSMAQMLQILGYRTVTVNDGAQACRMAEVERPDAAVVDIGMPEMNGLDVARWIRAKPWGQGMLMVALSGWGQESDRRASLDAGFDHHFVKPLEIEALTRLLSQRA